MRKPSRTLTVSAAAAVTAVTASSCLASSGSAAPPPSARPGHRTTAIAGVSGRSRPVTGDRGRRLPIVIPPNFETAQRADSDGDTDDALTADQPPPAANLRSAPLSPGSNFRSEPAQTDLNGSRPAVSPGLWACIAARESGLTNADTGNGYQGFFQFTPSSWAAAGGGPGGPLAYGYATQLRVAQRLQRLQGWGAWPVTSRLCGAT